MIENMRMGEWRMHVSIAEADMNKEKIGTSVWAREIVRATQALLALRAVNTPDTWMRCVLWRGSTLHVKGK